MGKGVVIRIGRVLVQTPLGARPGLGTQPRFEAPSNLKVENAKRRDQHWVSEAVPSIMAQSWP